jgi:hypothetical protein
VTKNEVLYDEINEAVAADFPGVAVFSYSEIFPDHRQTQRAFNIYETFVKAIPGTPVQLPSPESARAPRLDSNSGLKIRSSNLKTRLTE